LELSPKQQINELIRNSTKILVLSHSNLNGDAIGGMLALERVLAKMGKEVSLVSSNSVEASLTFLPGIEKVKKDINGTRDLVIRIDKEKFPVEKLSYNEDDGNLNIIISPKDGQIKSEDIQLLQGEFKFDLIFVLDTPDVDKIDSVYDRHTELFFETPIVNVDHHAGNEYFGTVNMVDLTATSTCEILVSIIESLGANNFDADVATCLLAGIISDTASFKNVNTTPKSLTISAQMLAAGARQQEIIQNLYKTRPLNTLKLWGKVLSRLEHDKEHRLIYSFVTYDDFKETGASVEDIRHIMDELLGSTPGADVVLLLAEHEPQKVAGKLKGINGQDVLAIAEIFGGSGQVQSAGFDLVNAELEKTVPEVIEKIRSFRDKQLGRDKIEHIEKPVEIEIPKREEAEEKTEAHNHLPSPEETEVKNEIEQLEEKVEENSVVEPIEVIENKPEIKELFEKFISSEAPVDNERPIEEAREIPLIDPIVQALESLENKETSLSLDLPEEETSESVENVESESLIDSGSISSEEDLKAPNIDTPNTLSKEDTLKAIGDIIKGYQPGAGIRNEEEKEEK
jgi:phosphoesterase RecJ-like protein